MTVAMTRCMRFVVSLGFLVGATALAGCASEPYYLQNNASGALGCPESHVDVDYDRDESSRRARVYTASGCGRTVTYVCSPNGLDCDGNR